MLSRQNPVIPPGIDPGTVRVVAQSLNNYAAPVPKENMAKLEICIRLGIDRSNFQHIYSSYVYPKYLTKYFNNSDTRTTFNGP